MLAEMASAVDRYENEYWPVERELLAQTIEHISALISTTVAMWGGKGTKTPEITKIPRPHETKEQERKLSPREGFLKMRGG